MVGALIAALVSLNLGCTGAADSDGSTAVGTAATIEAPRLDERGEWGVLFADAHATGTFALREVGSETTTVWNVERASDPRRPASTFKILNSLIILETGVLPDVDTVVPWDGIERSVSEWNRDHSLRTGLEVSAVWAFQELARQVGDRRMQRWVTRADYGNADVGGGIDRFWLSGDLRISPLQQLDFLERLAGRELPFRIDVQDAVADILVRERGDDWTWSHKTGTALSEDPDLGWLVGLSSYDDRTFVFAMNLDLESTTDLAAQLDPQVRQNLTRAILRREGALPP